MAMKIIIWTYGKNHPWKNVCPGAHSTRAEDANERVSLITLHYLCSLISQSGQIEPNLPWFSLILTPLVIWKALKFSPHSIIDTLKHQLRMWPYKSSECKCCVSCKICKYYDSCPDWAVARCSVLPRSLRIFRTQQLKEQN